MSFDEEHGLKEKKEAVVRKMKKPELKKKEGTESWVKTTSKHGFPKHIKVNRYY